jgi:hypothetical protein
MTASLTVSRTGTIAQPIQLVGPRTATLDFGGNSAYRFLHVTTDWWIFAGFTHSRSFVGPLLEGANNNVLCDMVTEHTGQEGVKFRGGSSFNTLQDSVIRDTGENAFWYGEGIYIGTGATGTDPANFNRVLRNQFGPNVRAEHVDNKTGTTGTLIEGNVSDATGYRYTNGSDSNGQVTTGVYANGGVNATFVGNTINNLNSPNTIAYQNWQGSGTTYHRNSVSPGPFKYGYATQGGSGNVIGCDNTAVGGPFANVPCQ